MSTTLTLDSQRVALELYSLLREIDPARWKDDLARNARAKLADIQQHLQTLIAAIQPDVASLLLLRARLVSLSHLIATTTPAEGVLHLRAAWNELRLALLPAYEELALSLQALDLHVPSLRPTNYARNVLHIGSGLGVVLLIQHILTDTTMPIVAVVAALSAWGLELSRRLVPAINTLCMKALGPFAHPHEAWRINSSTWFTTALLGLGLSGDRVLAATAVAVLALGDPMAALVGRKFGKTKLVNGRSAEGSLAFVLFGTLAAMAALAVYGPGLSLGRLLGLAAAAAVPAAIAELLVRRIDDNLAIPLTAAAGLWLAGLL